MTQVALGIAVGGLAEELTAKCPFKDEDQGVDEEQDENIEDDDEDSVQSEQHNNGGTLGTNLIDASNGASGTVGGPVPPPDAENEPRRDTKRNSIWVKVPQSGNIDQGDYAFTLAAHHLIPGNASLWPSEVKPYMTKGETVTAESGKSWTIKKYIGYNVNGAHNGVWLPGNYAIRKGSSPTGATWSSLVKTHQDWCLTYMAAATKVGEGQFHDTHTQYSDKVKKLLNKVATGLSVHQESCEECGKKSEVNPPFTVKARLFNLSIYLRQQLKAHPVAWKRPWFASDSWRDAVFSGDEDKKQKFDRAYEGARRVIRLE